jgi:uncharacterized protein YndB with AHSA1/START domain
MAASQRIDLAGEPEDRVLVITRTFDAPRSLVFRVWTEPEHLSRWWGPRDFTVLYYKAEVRPGGAFRFGMRSPEGTEHRAHGVYREVAAPERLVFTTAWEDEEGKPKHETLVTLTFAEQDGKTKLTLRQALFESATSRDLHEGGWSSTLDLLAEYLAKI